MILIFLGSFRATSAVFLSIPLSALATFVVLSMMGNTINTMILGGLALAFSRIVFRLSRSKTFSVIWRWAARPQLLPRSAGRR